MRKVSSQNKGFTLTEMLVAIAILIILLAIAVPALGSLRKDLKLTEYDDTARQIYMVAQNRLTTMKAAGTLGTFYDTVEASYSGNRLTEQPQDHIAENDDWSEMYHFSDSDDIIAASVIGSDSVLLDALSSNGHFCIELNPETGDVYSVFYAEREFDYNEILSLPSRNKSDRKDAMLGYYGGVAGLSAVSDLPTEFSPALSIVNKEDLYLHIECEGMRKLVKTQNNIIMTVTLTDEDYTEGNTAEHTMTINLKGGTDFWISKDKVSVDVLLDSVRGGKESFAEITQGKLNLGDDITAVVAMTYASNDANITGASAAVESNSLFASIALEDETNINVAYVRHINNLKYYDSALAVTISQTADIDYDHNNWADDAVISSERGKDPNLGSFSPVENDELLTGSTYNGNDNKLLNFDIRGTENTGFFGSLEDVKLQNMKLVNFSVSGGSYAGALAGQMKDGSIDNCQVYLQAEDEYGRRLSDMAERVKKYAVSGSGYVGGMVGHASGVTVTDSFAAINVSGTSRIGGFAGLYSGGSVLNSYSSGNVSSAGSYAGGFAGEISAAVENCYSTSNVTAPSYAGGFAGAATGGSIRDTSSYGLVQKPDETMDISTSGGFVGTASSCSFTNCKFLKQASYNYEYKTPTGVTGGGFTDLRPTTPNSYDDSVPYSDDLVGRAFPFVLARDSEGSLMIHYGDWPSELKLQTSLVYYEKYEEPDASGNYYGYYAETSLAIEGEETGDDTNKWMVNTLRDEVCIEDGYAIMTIYALSRFDYVLNDDIDKSAQRVTVYTSETQGENTALKIADDASLRFINTEDNSTCTISNARLYQLPFDLQIRVRNVATRFYDRMTVTGYVGDNSVFENYTFFYCPEFAKNAINPDVSRTAADTPKNPTGEENPVYIRSARHLNALGRSAYYWNTTKYTDGSDYRYHFVQETDVDFGKYVKTYCGCTFNLMDTSVNNDYRNLPIGRPNSQSFTDPAGNTYTPSNFRNSYDGKGNQIIDYCCVTTQADKYQFTGLFGEVQGSTIKNIVMVASDPKNESGYVISKYNDGGHSAGVGALAGLNYVDNGNEYSGIYATISNCSVSGYTVKAETGTTKYAYAVGGLVGFNFGKIENCSAVNKETMADIAGGGDRYVGGLVGSLNGRGTITNCYTGGTVSAASGTSGSCYLSGICGGFNNIYGAYYTDQSNRGMSVENCYSYCTWNNSSLNGTAYAVVRKSDKISVNNCSYLTDTAKNVTFGDSAIVAAMDFDKLTELSFTAKGTAVASGRATADSTHPWSSSLEDYPYSFAAVIIDPVTNDYVHYGDWYYESVKINSGYSAYYETYSDNSVAIGYLNDDNKLIFTDSYDTNNSKVITEAGYCFLYLQGNTGGISIDGVVLTRAESLKKGSISVDKGVYDIYALTSAQEGLITPSGNENAKVVKFAYEIVEGKKRTTVEKTIYINGKYAAVLSASMPMATETSPIEVRTEKQLNNMTGSGKYFKMTHDVYATTVLGEITNNGFNFDGGYERGGTEKTYSNYRVGSNGNHIFGLQKPLFTSVNSEGSVKNLALIGVNMSSTSSNLAPVTLMNYGTVENTFATGTIETASGAKGSAGLVYNNAGTVRSSYANCYIKNQNGSAAGLMLINSGKVESCYAAGSVAAYRASGAIIQCNTGSAVSDCYTIAEISASLNAYGFAPSGSTGVGSTNYWARVKNGVNGNVTDSAGTEITPKKLTVSISGTNWSADNDGATYPMTMSGAYPYPRLTKLDHCGDWIEPAGEGKFGAYRLYRQKTANYAKGQAINLSDNSVITYSHTKGSAYTATVIGITYNYYGVLFDEEFAEDISNWNVTYTYSFWGEHTENVQLNTVSGITFTGDAEGMISNLIYIPNYRTMKNITFTNILSGETYVFEYSNNNFEYVE